MKRTGPRPTPRPTPPAAPSESASAADSASADKHGWWLILAGRPRLLLALVVVASLAPFVGKAVHVDDTLFVYAARQMTVNPLDYYGTTVNWNGVRESLADVTKNPPLASGYLALVLATWGEHLAALHLAMLLPSVALIWAVYDLAGGLCRRPLWVALASWSLPVVLVSGTTLMCDVPMLALWCLALVAWRRADSRANGCWYLAAGALVGAAALTKYFALALVPLLAGDLLWRRARRQPLSAEPLALAGLAVAMAIVAAFEAYNRARYGHGLIGDAARYALESAAGSGRISVYQRWLVTFVYLGGCLLPTLLLAPRIWSPRQLLALATAATGLVLPVLMAGHFERLPLRDGWRPDAWSLAHLWCFTLAGVQVAALGVAELWRRRDADTLLLVAGLWGTIVFTAGVNWNVNARSLLPAAPAAVLLIARRWEAASDAASERAKRPTAGDRGWVLAIAGGLVLSLAVAQGDQAVAGAFRDGALESVRRAAASKQPIWFTGHWGYQYYLEAAGATALDLRADRPGPGDWLLAPYTVDAQPPPADLSLELREVIEVPVGSLVATVSKAAHAHWYSLAPLPYALTRSPPERFFLLRVVEPAR